MASARARAAAPPMQGVLRQQDEARMCVSASTGGSATSAKSAAAAASASTGGSEARCLYFIIYEEAVKRVEVGAGLRGFPFFRGFGEICGGVEFAAGGARFDGARLPRELILLKHKAAVAT